MKYRVSVDVQTPTGRRTRATTLGTTTELTLREARDRALAWMIDQRSSAGVVDERAPTLADAWRWLQEDLAAKGAAAATVCKHHHVFESVLKVYLPIELTELTPFGLASITNT